MVPLVGSVMELHLVRDEIDPVVAEASEGVTLDVPIGTMIELPRAALTRADRRVGQFFLRHQRPHPDDEEAPRRRRSLIFRPT